MKPRETKDESMQRVESLVTKLSKEEKEKEILMKTEINDAIHK